MLCHAEIGETDIQPDTIDVSDTTLIQSDTVHNFPSLETVAQCEETIAYSGKLDSDLVTALEWPSKRQDKLDLLEKPHVTFPSWLIFITSLKLMAAIFSANG